ncbi:MAG: hypothetical protein Fur0044_54570 [Anaerolineae bacterium]
MFGACLFVALTITVASSITAAVTTLAAPAATIVSITRLPPAAIAGGEIARRKTTIAVILTVAAGYAIALARVVFVKAIKVIPMPTIMVAFWGGIV